jgi:hypothetical protein
MKELTNKKFRKKVKRLGGTIEYPTCCVNFPKNFRIYTKKEALALLDVLIQDVYPENSYSISVTEPYIALREAIKRGLQ